MGNNSLKVGTWSFTASKVVGQLNIDKYRKIGMNSSDDMSKTVWVWVYCRWGRYEQQTRKFGSPHSDSLASHPCDKVATEKRRA